MLRACAETEDLGGKTVVLGDAWEGRYCTKGGIGSFGGGANLRHVGLHWFVGGVGEWDLWFETMVLGT